MAARAGREGRLRIGQMRRLWRGQRSPRGRHPADGGRGEEPGQLGDPVAGELVPARLDRGPACRAGRGVDRVAVQVDGIVVPGGPRPGGGVHDTGSLVSAGQAQRRAADPRMTAAVQGQFPPQPHNQGATPESASDAGTADRRGPSAGRRSRCWPSRSEHSAHASRRGGDCCHHG
jgi:hypothetical protein